MVSVDIAIAATLLGFVAGMIAMAAILTLRRQQ